MINQALRLKYLEKENQWLGKAVSDLILDALILKEVVAGSRQTAKANVLSPSRPRADEKPPAATIIRLAQQYGRYAFHRITALLRNEGWLALAVRSYDMSRHGPMMLTQS